MGMDRASAAALGFVTGFIILASLAPGGGASVYPGMSLTGGLFTSLAHIPVYGLAMYLAAGSTGGASRLVLCGSGLLALGLLIECVQPLVGRSAALADLAFNALGVTVGGLSALAMARCRAVRIAEGR